jgi:hypothetical protein
MSGRRLREFENEGVIEVEYRKNHAWYRLNQMSLEKRSREALHGLEALRFHKTHDNPGGLQLPRDRRPHSSFTVGLLGERV